MTRRPSGAAPEAGFTLLETLVALTVLGFLMASLSAALGFSLKAWRSHDAAADLAGDLDAVDRTLRELVTDMEPADSVSGEAPFSGGPHTATFRTLLPGVLGDGPGRRVEVGLGVDADRRFVLRSWPLFRSLRGPPPVTQTVLLNGVRKIDLDYWDPQQARWSPEWSGADLPGLVRVRIVLAEQSGRPWPDVVAAPRRQREQP